MLLFRNTKLFIPNIIFLNKKGARLAGDGEEQGLLLCFYSEMLEFVENPPRYQMIFQRILEPLKHLWKFREIHNENLERLFKPF